MLSGILQYYHWHSRVFRTNIFGACSNGRPLMPSYYQGETIPVATTLQAGMANCFCTGCESRGKKLASRWFSLASLNADTQRSTTFCKVGLEISNLSPFYRLTYKGANFRAKRQEIKGKSWVAARKNIHMNRVQTGENPAWRVEKMLITMWKK